MAAHDSGISAPQWNTDSVAFTTLGMLRRCTVFVVNPTPLFQSFAVIKPCNKKDFSSHLMQRIGKQAKYIEKNFNHHDTCQCLHKCGYSQLILSDCQTNKNRLPRCATNVLRRAHLEKATPTSSSPDLEMILLRLLHQQMSIVGDGQS